MQKVFYGKSVFGIDRAVVDIDSVVIDDVHYCIEEIKNAFTIRLDSETSEFEALLNLFTDDIKSQGEARYLDIDANRTKGTISAISYWSWINKISQVPEILSKVSNLSTKIVCMAID